MVTRIKELAQRVRTAVAQMRATDRFSEACTDAMSSRVGH